MTDLTPVDRAPATRQPAPCRSRSRYGRCGRTEKHDGPHAVPIGGGVWFGYLRDRHVSPPGYGHLDGGTFTPINPAPVGP